MAAPAMTEHWPPERMPTVSPSAASYLKTPMIWSSASAVRTDGAPGTPPGPNVANVPPATSAPTTTPVKFRPGSRTLWTGFWYFAIYLRSFDSRYADCRGDCRHCVVIEVCGD